MFEKKKERRALRSKESGREREKRWLREKSGGMKS